MLHPSDQAVDYIFERLAATYFSEATHAFIKAWEPIREALNHRPFNPDSEAYKAFLIKTMEKYDALRKQYPTLS